MTFDIRDRRNEMRMVDELEREIEQVLGDALAEDGINGASLKSRLMPIIDRFADSWAHRAFRQAAGTPPTPIQDLRRLRELDRV